MSTPFEDLVGRQLQAFRIFLAAVAGLRAASSAAGIRQPNIMTRKAVEELGASFVANIRYESLRFMQDFNADGIDEQDFTGRYSQRYERTLDAISSVVRQVVEKGNRELIPAVELSKMLNDGAGAIGLLIQQRIAQPKFQVKDGAGRTWDAEKLFAVIARDFGYQTYIDHRFAEAITSGETAVEASDGTVYHLDASWLEARDQDFHINSKKVL